jgi:alpha-galactosidase
MPLAGVVALLQSALMLLTLVAAHPEFPQSVRDNANQVAQQAITQATAALAANPPSGPRPSACSLIDYGLDCLPGFHKEKRYDAHGCEIAPVCAADQPPSVSPSPSPAPQKSWLQTRLNLPATQIPFSFAYGTTSPTTWSFTEASTDIGNNRTLHTTIYTDPNSPLRLTVEATEYRSTNAVEWVLRFKNTGKSKLAPVSSILPLDYSLGAITPGVQSLFSSNGSTASVSDFESHLTNLASPMVFETHAGRSSDPTLPFFDAFGSQGGDIIAIGWSGDWRARFNPTGGDMSKITAGMPEPNIALLPNETVRTPSVLIMPWSGSDYRQGQLAWRKFLLDSILPQVTPPISLTEWMGLNDTTSANVGATLANLAVHLIPNADSFWLDAGWYAGGWDRAGSWEANPQRFSAGMPVVGTAAAAAGLKFILWYEPERATPESTIAQAHPQWILSEGSASSFMPGAHGLFNFADHDALVWAKQYYADQIRRNGVDVFRIDFNIEPRPYWHLADAPDRVGATEMHYIENLYEFLDSMIASRPGLFIDNSASGGRRLDLEMFKRSIPLLHSDLSASETAAQQSLTYGLLAWLPIFGGQAVSTFSNDTILSSFAPTMNLDATLATYDSNVWSATAYWAKLTKLIQPLWRGDLWQLSGLNDASKPVLAWELYRSDLGQEFVQVFARGSAAPVTPPLMGLDPNAQYQILDIESPWFVKTVPGQSLMGTSKYRASLAAANLTR